MTARAASTAATLDRILDAARTLWAAQPIDQIRLEEIAERADVTVPTVVRRAGGKPAIFSALVKRELARLETQRTPFSSTSVDDIAAYFVDYYEQFGFLILKLYAEAPQVPGLPELAASARARHLESVREAFAGRLTDGPDSADRRMAQIIAVLDATTWRILRAEAALSPEQTQVAILELISPLVRRP